MAALPRPYWKGYLKLSLVSCPIAVYASTSSSERIAFKQVNRLSCRQFLRQIKGSEKMGEPKTAQPFSDEIKETSSLGTGTEPKPRPDAVDDPKKKEESPKTTQRTE